MSKKTKVVGVHETVQQRATKELLAFSRGYTKDGGVQPHQKIGHWLSEGADPLAVDQSGCTALHYLAGSGNAASIELLLPASDILKPGHGGRLPIHVAAESGDVKTIKLLAKAYKKIVQDKEVSSWLDARDHAGETPLMRAAVSESVECVKFLISLGADPKALSHEGVSALRYAAILGSVDTVKVLLPLSDGTTTESSGNGLALWSVNHPEILTMLLEAGAPCGPNGKGVTPLMVAAENGVSKSVELLLRVSNPCAVDSQGRSALWLAASVNITNAVKSLELIVGALEAKLTPVLLYGELCLALGAAMASENSQDRVDWLTPRVMAARESLVIHESMQKPGLAVHRAHVRTRTL